MAIICFLVSVWSSVFETQYAALGVRQATRRSRSPAKCNSYSRPPTVRFSVGLSRIGGFLQVVPCKP